MREHFIPQDGVHTYNTRLSSKGKFVIPKVKSWSKIILLQRVLIMELTTTYY